MGCGIIGVIMIARANEKIIRTRIGSALLSKIGTKRRNAMMRTKGNQSPNVRLLNCVISIACISVHQDSGLREEMNTEIAELDDHPFTAYTKHH